MELKEAKEKCNCPICPSYVECEELVFCLGEKSKCIKLEKGCICGACPVHSELKLKHGYYCNRNSEKKQEKK